MKLNDVNDGGALFWSIDKPDDPMLIDRLAYLFKTEKRSTVEDMFLLAESSQHSSVTISGPIDLVYVNGYGVTQLSIDQTEFIVLLTTFPETPFYECQNQLITVFNAEHQKIAVFYAENECEPVTGEEELEKVRKLGLNPEDEHVIVVHTN